MANNNSVDTILFHGIELEALYGFSRHKIYEWLNKTANKLQPPRTPDNPADNPPDQTLPVREDLVDIVKQLRLLSIGDDDGATAADKADGNEYDDGKKGSAKSLAPKQHIYRKIVTHPGGYDTKKYATTSKFYVGEDFKHTFLRGGDSRIYWSPTDLLGLFLSKLGPAPEGADKVRFYLPLTAVYARWSSLISGSLARPGKLKTTGVGSPATIFQCTWRSDNNLFFLGSSLCGQATDLPAIHGAQWETVLKTRRFRLLTPYYQGLKFDSSPKRDEWKKGNSKTDELDSKPNPKPDPDPKPEIPNPATRFGNCGETYPFVEMMWHERYTNKEKREKFHGLALHSKATNRLGKYDPLTILKPSKKQVEPRPDDDILPTRFEYLWNPCSNCKQLIAIAGARMHNFAAVDGLPDRAK